MGLKSKTWANRNLIVLKLGGSVVTYKEKPMTANANTINRLAKEIADSDVERLIIVHGGGSFGHPIAKLHRIKEGLREQSQIQGFSKTHQAMVELNKLIVDILISHNIPAFSVSPSSCLITKAGRVELFFEDTVAQLLRTGFVPVLFGDAVLDNQLGFTILSGDQLVTALALQFKAKRVVFGADVDGLFTADPKSDKSAQLIPRITLDELKKLLRSIEMAKVTDVTGGMLGKILELIPAISKGIQALVVNATKEGNIHKTLIGERIGTLIEKE